MLFEILVDVIYKTTFSEPELKAQGSYCDHLMSVYRVRCPCVNFAEGISWKLDKN